jgi:hypothetical protein
MSCVDLAECESVSPRESKSKREQERARESKREQERAKESKREPLREEKRPIPAA